MSQTYFRHALPVGEVLVDYQVLSVLGTGGFGVTYLVQHRVMGDRFAIKEYFPQSLAERESSGTVMIRTHAFEDSYYKGLHGFLEEARIVRRLRGHPNVVHVNSFFEANNTAYMVMEYYSGQTLAAFRKQCGDQLDEASIRRLLLPVLDALEYIHQRDVVHRDLKPDNIFLCEDGRPILLDFGASRFATAGSTLPMTAVLTPGFAPPEQYISEDSGETILRQGPWTDLYALGAVLHMLACGRPPYDAMSRQMSGSQDPQPPAATRLQGFSAAYCNAVDACLRLDMKQRPQNVAQFRSIWNAGLGGVPPLPPLPAQPAAAPPVPVSVPAAGSATGPAGVREGVAPARSLLPLWLLAAVLLLAAGAGGWWYLQQPRTSVPQQVQVGPPAVRSPVAEQGTLLVLTDVDCELRVNGQTQGVLQAGKSRAVTVPAGEQIVECGVEGHSGQTQRQTRAVLSGQQAVVELQLAGLAGAGGNDPHGLQRVDVLRLPAPDFKPAFTGNAAGGGPVGRQLAMHNAEAADVESWFARNDLSVAYAPGPSRMGRPPSWTAGYRIPDFVPERFAEQALLKVIDSVGVTLALYGRDFSSARILLAQHSGTGAVLYALDFTAYAAAPQRIEADRDFVDQQIVWAQQQGNVLYVAHGHSTYAKSSYGRNAYISALEVGGTPQALWHSAALVSNAGNFIVHGDSLISGYGFTAEPDFLFVLDRSDGSVRKRIPLKSGPDFLIGKGGRLYVRVYDTEYEFELK